MQEVPPKVREKVPPEVPNNPPIGNDMLEKFKVSMSFLSQEFMTQYKRGEVSSANPIGGMSSTTIREFLRMNLPDFYGANVNVDPNGFINEVYKVLAIMGVSSI